MMSRYNFARVMMILSIIGATGAFALALLQHNPADWAVGGVTTVMAVVWMIHAILSPTHKY